MSTAAGWLGSPRAQLNSETQGKESGGTHIMEGWVRCVVCSARVSKCSSGVPLSLSHSHSPSTSPSLSFSHFLS